MSMLLNGGHTGLYGGQGAGLSMVWQRAVADDARPSEDRQWQLASLASMLSLLLVLLSSREPFAFRLPALW